MTSSKRKEARLPRWVAAKYDTFTPVGAYLINTPIWWETAGRLELSLRFDPPSAGSAGNVKKQRKCNEKPQQRAAHFEFDGGIDPRRCFVGLRQQQQIV